jgi:transcription antitermination protein NusB
VPVARRGRGARSDVRERALHLLYEGEMKGLDAEEVLAGLPVAPDPYAVKLVRGVWAHRAAHDEVIKSFLRSDWSIRRLALLDLLVLRLACEELAQHPEVDVPVVLNEAIELAKTYSGEEAGKFVNGILANIAGALRPG